MSDSRAAIWRDAAAAFASADLDDAQRVRAAINELERRLANLKAQEVAELHAFVTCGGCSRIYGETEWGSLEPSPNGLHRKDEHDLQEVRRCNTPGCEATMFVVLETYGGYPYKGARRTVAVKADRAPSWCGGCDKPIELGMTHAVYFPRTTGRQRLPPRRLCPDCDTTSRFEPSCSAPPAPKKSGPHHDVNCGCSGCEALREDLARHFA